jgi:hypothetical protein
MYDKLQKLANMARNRGDYRLVDLVTSIIVDLGFVETNKYIVGQLVTTQQKAKQIKAQLDSVGLYRHSSQLEDVVAELDQRIKQFSSEDPIQSVLQSYLLLHKVAQHQSNVSSDVLNKAIEIANDYTLTDQQIIQQVEKLTLGLPEVEKKKIFYVLHKDHQVSIPQEKYGEAKFVENPQTDQQQQINKQIIEQTKKQQKQKKDKDKWYQSFPSSPYIWSGFAYEAIVPYQQSSQINYWTVASKQNKIKDLIKILKK